MNPLSVLVLGGTGLIGSAVSERLAAAGHSVLALNSRNYDQHIGARADVLINCNGNSYRFKAAQDPRWDFDASVLTVEKSLFDFKFDRYFYFSTVDVYNDIGDPSQNHESVSIQPTTLHPYGFHKWMAERLVERYVANHLILRTGTVFGRGVKKGPLFDLSQEEPLRMSVDSELTLIDTPTIADTIAAFLEVPDLGGILNLTGSGPASLRDICESAKLRWRLAPGAEATDYHYHINNARLRGLYPVPTSQEMAVRFLASTVKHNA